MFHIMKPAALKPSITSIASLRAEKALDRKAKICKDGIVYQP